ncbi:MAG: hypothetical protein IPM48_08190 [Saprospiraceae bacterium]|nr:hypothetical protein [Saprospiraceae bacterium]
MLKQFLFLILFSILWTSKTDAQFEVKAQPIAFLFEAFPISLEYGFREDWGFETDMIAADGLFQLTPGIKYYFNNSERGFDRWYCGAFGLLGTYGSDGVIGFGFNGGYKYVSRKNIIFEIALGIGRGFGDGTEDNIIGTGKLHLGYRFGSNK